MQGVGCLLQSVRRDYSGIRLKIDLYEGNCFAITTFVAQILFTKRKAPDKSGTILLVQGVGFEPTKAEPTDLQSAVFDRFTNPAD